MAWTATATLCCRLIRLPYSRRPPPSRARCSAAQSPDVVDKEYADLNLRPLYPNEPTEPPEWKEVFEDPLLPLMVDIGCGSGRFLIWHAKNSGQRQNYLGLEIRQKLVERTQFWVNELGLRNVYFMFANATVSFERIISSYPGPLSLVSILVLIQSDVLEVAADMRERFDGYSDILAHVDCVDKDLHCDNEGWLLDNPMGIRTEREIHAELEGATIYRRMYQKIRDSSH
nr:unnamed protein product [Digitaria exilis]